MFCRFGYPSLRAWYIAGIPAVHLKSFRLKENRYSQQRREEGVYMLPERPLRPLRRQTE